MADKKHIFFFKPWENIQTKFYMYLTLLDNDSSYVSTSLSKYLVSCELIIVGNFYLACILFMTYKNCMFLVNKKK